VFDRIPKIRDYTSMRTFPALLVLALFFAVGSGSAQELQCKPCWNVFPKTQVGQTSTYSFQLTNVGKNVLQITSITLPGGAFSLGNISLPANIQPGQSVSMPVTFAPTAVAYAFGAFYITSNDPSSPRRGQIAGAGIPNGSGGGGGGGASTLSISPATLSFGNVNVGSSATQSATLTASNGPVTISSGSTSSSQFAIKGLTFPLTIPAGQSVQATIQFTPSGTGAVSGQDQFVSNASNPSAAELLSGVGIASSQLTVSPSALSFGNVNVGSTASLQATLTATNGSVTISSGQTSSSQFAIAGLSFPLVIPAGQSVQATIQFTPGAAGSVTGVDEFVSNANSPQQSLTGTGVSNTASSQLTVSPSILSFGNVNVGSTATLPATLTASNGPVTISSDATSTSEFAITGISLPITLQAGQSVQATIQFTPNAAGAASAQDQFLSNASNSPGREQLTGTGIASNPHSASLSWQAGASGITGYNVYRGTTNGGPYSQVNSALVSAPSYTDSTVAGGSTYYYVTTEVNSQGQESGYSNVAEAQIP
jgi:Abnormal spindle-like microcephaly-assoc'd, ASPM-SPD-2-Hydin